MLEKVLKCILLSYLNYRRFSTLKICDKPVEVQIKHLEMINKMQNQVINVFIL